MEVVGEGAWKHPVLGESKIPEKARKLVAARRKATRVASLVREAGNRKVSNFALTKQKLEEITTNTSSFGKLNLKETQNG